MCLLLTCKSGDWLFNSAASGNVGEEKNWTIQTAHPQPFVLFWIGSSDQQREKKHVDTCIGVHAHTHTHTHTQMCAHTQDQRESEIDGEEERKTRKKGHPIELCLR